MQKVEAADDPQSLKFNSNTTSSACAFSSVDGAPGITSTAEFHRSLFDTPQSMLNSPQFDLFSTSFTSQLGSPGSRCHLCLKDQRDLLSLGCPHKVCSSCMPLLEGRKCRVCSSPSSFQHSLFMSPTGTPDRSEVTESDIFEPSDMSSSRMEIRFPSYREMQNVSLGASELQDSFGIWQNGRSKLHSTTFESLSPGAEHHSVFSPLPRFFPRSPATGGGRRSSICCAGCGAGSRASSYCLICHELLCNECVVAHQRVRMTKDHTVVTLDQLLGQLSFFQSPVKENGSTSGAGTSEDGSRPSSVCSLHEAPVICSCNNCAGSGLCPMCLPFHTNHKFSTTGQISGMIPLVLKELQQHLKTCDEAVEAVRRVSERINVSAKGVNNELLAAVHLHISALEERKRELLQKLETIRTDKQDIIKEQEEKLHVRRNQLVQIIKSLESADDNEKQAEQAFDQMISLFSQRFVLQPQETDFIKFMPPDSQLVSKCRALGELESGPCARTSTFATENYRRAIRDRQCSAIIQLRDACEEPPSAGAAQHVSATMLAPDGHFLDVHIEEREGGIVIVNYYPVVEGLHQLDVMVRGVSIKECPVMVEVRRGRNYADIAQRGELFSFGKEGSNDGELCRPWGICIDLRGRVLVADRSNNRIQVFDRDGNFLSKFGTSGARAGQFDRPAGITTNTLNHIIVADKDNHRIQVFDENGTFILKFGERGRPLGMFNYPWGVATNSKNDIAVSDTRNHRVQIFNSSGQFIRKCGFDTAYFYKHLDSPRGVCFLPDGQLLLSDFNNHRLAVLSSRNSEMKVYGCEGDVEGMFCRPQGIKVDPEGHILVCDSRNNRIQVFSSEDMRCVATFGNAPSSFQMPAELSPPLHVDNSTGVPFLPSAGGSPTQTATFRPLLDRPTDLAVSADGRVYVVDFGNNCIRVF